MLRRGVLSSVGAVSISSLGGCIWGRPPGEVTVEMTDDLTFEPHSVTVAERGTVTWENRGEVGHTVTAEETMIPDTASYFASGGFESEQQARNKIEQGLLGATDTYEHTFDSPGAYEYYCIPHESSGMVGSITVK